MVLAIALLNHWRWVPHPDDAVPLESDFQAPPLDEPGDDIKCGLGDIGTQQGDGWVILQEGTHQYPAATYRLFAVVKLDGGRGGDRPVCVPVRLTSPNEPISKRCRMLARPELSRQPLPFLARTYTSTVPWRGVVQSSIQAQTGHKCDAQLARVGKKLYHLIGGSCSRQIPQNQERHRLRRLNLAALKSPNLSVFASPRETRTSSEGSTDNSSSNSSAPNDEEPDLSFVTNNVLVTGGITGCATTGKDPTEQSQATASDLGEAARAVGCYLPNYPEGSSAVPTDEE